MSRKSEFGRGYKTCLIQFVFHEPRLDEDEAIYASMREKGHDDLFPPESAAELWMNGACDHLHDLIKPKTMVSNAEWTAAKALRDRAMDIGHSWRRESNGANPDECRALIAEARRLLGTTTTFDDAYKWDQDHGLRPSKGYSATCVEPIRTRAASREALL